MHVAIRRTKWASSVFVGWIGSTLGGCAVGLAKAAAMAIRLADYSWIVGSTAWSDGKGESSSSPAEGAMVGGKGHGLPYAVVESA